MYAYMHGLIGLIYMIRGWIVELKVAVYQECSSFTIEETRSLGIGDVG